MKTLLLTASCETLAFIPLRKLINLLVKKKIEVMAVWDESEALSWGSGSMPYPAVVRLTYDIKRHQRIAKFNRRGIFRRDMYVCQYCGKSVKPSKLTIDHIKPVSHGGKSSWENCVASCLSCNLKKANKTLEQANMKLLSIPKAPVGALTVEFVLTKPKHNDWHFYFKDVERIMPKSHVEFDDDDDYYT